MCCRYSLEAPHCGASNEYPQHIFSWRNKKHISSFWLKKKNALPGATIWTTLLNGTVCQISCILTLVLQNPNMPLQTVQIQISWLLKKPTDLDLHCLSCLSFSMWICIVDSGIKRSDWLTIRSGCVILIFSAWQGLTIGFALHLMKSRRTVFLYQFIRCIGFVCRFIYFTILISWHLYW